MKTDLYTKTVLSIIAGALTIIAFQSFDILPKANASKTNTGFISIPVNPDGSINVKMMDNMKVDIAAIGGSSIYGALPMNLKEVSGSSISGYGLPVNIEAVNGSSIYDALPVKMKN
ncbi:MAG: hypothetical protein EPN85_14155 [Bacteroidetes bacterium]|nr:MAG: hypothetical protein EPN85_14155 [Bacteroidota bacterium]